MTSTAVMAAKAKSTEVMELVPKDLAEVSTQVEGAAETAGQQVEAAAGIVKKTLEDMEDKTGMTRDKSPSLISMFNLDTIQRTLSDLAEGLVVNVTL